MITGDAATDHATLMSLHRHELAFAAMSAAAGRHAVAASSERQAERYLRLAGELR